MSSATCDVLLVGGGLANGLVAWWLRAERPELRVDVLERGPSLGGQHTWCFHESDLTAAQLERLRPLLTCSWPHYDVRFPRHARRMQGGYHAIRAADFNRVLSATLGAQVRFGCAARAVKPDGVVLEDGRTLRAPLVIDGRGQPISDAFELGWQTFLGQQLQLAAPHGLDAPLLMDASVPQEGGFRFLYLLPWDERTVLVEDTVYAGTPALDRPSLRARIATYAGQRGWQVAAILSEEEGALPIPLSGDLESYLEASPARVPKVGLRAALYHPTTGYSLPEAVRCAEAIAGLPASGLLSANVLAWQRARSRQAWRAGAYLRLLNRLLFQAARPHERVRVFERFYRLPAGLIRRFYAGRLTLPDKLRILSGRPPVSVLRALRCVMPRRRRAHAGTTGWGDGPESGPR